MRTKILLISVFLLLFLVSCGRTPINTYDARKGSEGIDLEFLPGSPPNYVYPGEDFTLNLRLFNHGAYPQEYQWQGYTGGYYPHFEGRLYVIGFDPNYISFTTNGELTPCSMAGGDPSACFQLPVDFYGKDQYNLQGSEQIITLQSNTVQTPQVDTVLTQDFVATLCYKYQTIATATVCLDPDPYGQQITEKPCNYQQVYDLGGGQGGPVAVTKVEETVSKSQVKFKIWISNIGDGMMFDIENYDRSCPAIDRRDLDTVHARVYLDGMELPCYPDKSSGSGYRDLRLYNNQGFIVCTTDSPIATSTAYQAALLVDLIYGYSESKRGSLKIGPI